MRDKRGVIESYFKADYPFPRSLLLRRSDADSINWQHCRNIGGEIYVTSHSPYTTPEQVATESDHETQDLRPLSLPKAISPQGEGVYA